MESTGDSQSLGPEAQTVQQRDSTAGDGPAVAARWSSRPAGGRAVPNPGESA